MGVASRPSVGESWEESPRHPESIIKRANRLAVVLLAVMIIPPFGQFPEIPQLRS